MCNFYKKMNHLFGSFGVYLTVISILVLIGSFIYSFFYTTFVPSSDFYFDINSISAYIIFWVVLFAAGKIMADKAPNSVFNFEDKKDIGKTDE